MTIFSFGPRRRKRFVLLMLLFFSVPLLALLPFASVKMLLFLPTLFWINLVGLPLAMIGIPYFEIHEFGAVPEGVAGYFLIGLGYLLAAFFLSSLGKKE